MTANGSQRKALITFVVVVAFIFAQAVWWVIFMARLVDEKVDMAEQLGADAKQVEQILQEESERQIMIGLEGAVFLLAILLGTWLIYRSLVRSEQLKFSQQNFLMAITHELRTPLASIKLYLDSLASNKIPLYKKPSIIPHMRQDVRKLEKLVEDVLEASRYDRDISHFRSEMFSLTNLVQECLDARDDLQRDVRIVINRDLSPDLLMRGDAGAIRRAIDAILDNSVKYSDSKTINIVVRLNRDKNLIRLTLTDDGIGFEPKEREAIFQRFYRIGSELTRRYEGSGLGLYLCREIIQAHGGKVTAHSEGIGKGTRIEIVLKSG